MNEMLNTTFTLAGRVAVVTGAASGIGKETALVLAQAGAAVMLGDVNQAGLDSTVAAIGGGRAQALRTDVSQRADVDALAAKALAAFGKIDIWVNCAAVLIKTPLLEADEASVDRGIAVNLKGVYWGCAAAGRAMKASGGGSIINISSGGGESGVPELSIYCMTKAAVNMVTRCAAKELGSFGIRANTIAPGWIDTPMTGTNFRNADGSIDPARREHYIRGMRQASPLGLTGEPRDIALAVLYLASDASRFMTGQILRPNGGVAML